MLILALLHMLVPAYLQSQHCFSHIHEQERLDSHPAYVIKKQQIESYTQNWIANYTQNQKSKATYQIPVVVHVVWHELEENISDEQIFSQIEVLNQDFQALNSDIELVPTSFRSLIADTEISFCLATKDPAGNLSNGITRTQTDYADIGTAQNESGLFRIFYTDAGGQNAWDPDKYLNIWIARRGYGSGSASFPGTSPTEEDGLVIDYRYFGTTGTATDNAPYNLGRTVTHEIGHYFNLLHPWGTSSNPDCEGDDEVADTPRQATTYLRECPKGQPVSCETADFYFNFMNYTDDACMAMFTLGQKMRMLAALEGPRSALKDHTFCSPVSTSNDPVTQLPFKLWNDLDARIVWIEAVEQTDIQINMHLYNLLGQHFWQQKNQRIHSREAIYLPELPTGIYILHLQWQGNSYAHKIFSY